jgi:hypothetical protein
MRYTATDSFETMPQPARKEVLEGVGASYSDLRSSILQQHEFGLTKLYNRFHAATERDTRIEELRALQRGMDIAVARAYGWDDLDLEHGFHEVPYLPENDRVRFTMSETARIEVLQRLSELNRQRYQEEVAQGLHGNTTGRTAPPTRRPISADIPQSSLDFGAIPANERRFLNAAEPRADYRAGPIHTIVDYLKSHPGWHAKADVRAATGITDGQWSTAITDLIAGGRVERQGDRRGTRYRLIE